MRSFLPIILIVSAGALFWTYIDPTYQDVQAVKAEVKQYDDALDKSKELKKLRDDLLAKYYAFPEDDLRRLEYLLPDTVDNIRLVLDIDTIAARYGMVIKELKLSNAANSGGDSFNPTGDEIKSVDLSFTVTTDYETFMTFLRDLQDSLRIIDVEHIEFTIPDKSNLANYGVTVRTYWLP